MKITYNLTTWQKIQLPFLWLYWLAYDPNERKSWHLVKKGMEKHEHKYTESFVQSGVTFMKCSHEGCTMCDIPD